MEKLTMPQMHRYARPEHMQKLAQDKSVLGTRLLMGSGKELAPAVSRAERIRALSEQAQKAERDAGRYDAIVRIAVEGHEGRRALLRLKKNEELAPIAEQVLRIFFSAKN